MKLYAITLAIAVAGFAGTAAAADQQSLPMVSVSAAVGSACEPPSDAPVCGSFHQWIRANFSRREIGMLFGDRTSYPEYLTGGIALLRERYQARVQEYVAARIAPSDNVAAK